MEFYLGIPKPVWLERTNVPCCISRSVLWERRRLPRPQGPWILDSGGFTEVTTHGRWLTNEEEFLHQTLRIVDRMGVPVFAAPQDWMCEPNALESTGLSLEEHQKRTAESFVRLRKRASHIPWIPVLQGWTQPDYLRCVQLYQSAGVDLVREPVVGVGTICRRQGMADAETILRWTAHAVPAARLRLHAFGLKLQGVRSCRGILESSDSMAWSYHARRNGLDRNSLDVALEWRVKILEALDAPLTAQEKRWERFHEKLESPYELLGDFVRSVVENDVTWKGAVASGIGIPERSTE